MPLRSANRSSSTSRGTGASTAAKWKPAYGQTRRCIDILLNDYVIVALYSDDKKVLPESDWVTTDAGKVLKSLGKINSYYALKTYGVNAQPYYVLQGRNGKQLVPPRGYDLNVDNFVGFLKSGVEAYNAQK